MSGVLSWANLLASFVPGAGFAFGACCLARTERFAWLQRPAMYPWELWVVAVAGLTATTAGVLDWRYHRRTGVVVGVNERRAEFLALGLGGVPLFLLLALATVSTKPRAWLVPIFVAMLATTWLVAFDEFAFHRKRCKGIEPALHTTLLLGHAVAALAWVHLVFVRLPYAT